MNSQTEYSINLCCGFQATTLTYPRGQLPLENVEWPKTPSFLVEHAFYPSFLAEHCFSSEWYFCLDESSASSCSEATYMERLGKDSPSYSQQSFWELLSLRGYGDCLSKRLSPGHPAELAWLWPSHYSPNSACGGIRLKSQTFTKWDKGLKW